MPDSTTGEPQLPKRQRNLVAFSLAVLIIGWAPTTMQSSFSFLGIQFSKVDPAYMWIWALAINGYLLLAWIYTSRAEDKWLLWNGPKIQTLLRYKDHFWLRHFWPRKFTRHSVRSHTLNIENKGDFLRKAVKVYEMRLSNPNLYRKLAQAPDREMLISEEQFKKELRFPSRGRGHLVRVLEGRRENGRFWLMTEFHPSGGNPISDVRQTLKELYFSVLTPLSIGILGVLTALQRLTANI